MRLRDVRLQLALTAALAAGTACRSQPGSPDAPATPASPSSQPVDAPATPTGGIEPVDPVASKPPKTEAAPVIQVGQAPDGLAESCAVPVLEGFTLAEPVDFIALRTHSDMRSPKSSDGATWGTACAGATDKATCEATLAKTHPESSGYGYCGMGCSDTGLVYTRGDTVGLADSPAEAAALFGTVDTVSEVIHLARAHDYKPDCASLVAVEGGYQLEGTFQVSDCPFTDERRLLSVTADGTLTQLKMLERKEGGGCAGRRPDGLCTADAASDDPVAQHLAHLAHLEAAAVVAFERLALDLERVGAPAQLVVRARRAAEDEVRHAARMSEQARRQGAEPAPVHAAPHDLGRDLLALAVENAVEGCVRETFGVVDALHRAQTAPTAELRALFAEIAEDEACHSELSWEIHRWMLGRLSSSDRLRVLTAMQAAHVELREELATATDGPLQEALGAPAPRAAVAMADALRDALA